MDSKISGKAFKVKKFDCWLELKYEQIIWAKYLYQVVWNIDDEHGSTDEPQGVQRG